MSKQILIFAKAPIPGFCKTRLGRRIGYPRAAQVYKGLITASVHAAKAVPGAEVLLYCAPDATHPFLRGIGRSHGLMLRRQCAGDLGQRMHAALAASLSTTDQALLIGTDCPAMTAEHLQQAFTILEQGRDMVFTPATDGGFVLVGANRVEKRVFHAVAWGTAGVMQQTRRRLQRSGLSWQEQKTLPDLDDFNDYRQAQRDAVLYRDHA